MPGALCILKSLYTLWGGIVESGSIDKCSFTLFLFPLSLSPSPFLCLSNRPFPLRAIRRTCAALPMNLERSMGFGVGVVGRRLLLLTVVDVVVIVDVVDV